MNGRIRSRIARYSQWQDRHASNTHTSRTARASKRASYLMRVLSCTMSGNPVAKSNKVDEMCREFASFATRVDQLLPSIYRFDGKPPGRDRRANAWAKCDQHTVLLADALRELQALLRDRVNESRTAPA